LSRRALLDKIAISKHPDACDRDLAFALQATGTWPSFECEIHRRQASPRNASQSVRFGFDGIELGLGMKFITGLVAVVLLLAGVGASHAVVRIADDRGGRIGTYVDRYQGLRTSGEYVIIDGLCASACTIVLGAVPHDKICVTSHANLGFHAAWDFGANGRAVTNPEATQMLYSMYPSQIRRWISQRGGLTPRMIFLHGRELQTMYRPCYMDAQALSPAKTPAAPASATPAASAASSAAATSSAAASSAAASSPMPASH
jgi:hypothetical protein